MYIYMAAKTQIKEDTVPSEEMSYDKIMFVKPLRQSARCKVMNTPGGKL